MSLLVHMHRLVLEDSDNILPLLFGASFNFSLFSLYLHHWKENPIFFLQIILGLQSSTLDFLSVISQIMLYLGIQFAFLSIKTFNLKN
jgi:hypothetical protein